MTKPFGGMPPSPSQNELMPTAEVLHEAKARVIREQIENELAGTEKAPGILGRIQRLSTLEEERALAKELRSLISRSGLLFLAGYTEAAKLGVTNFRAAQLQIKGRQRPGELDAADPSDSSFVLRQEAHCATVLEYALNLVTQDPKAATQLQIIPSFSAADYTLLNEEPYHHQFELFAHRVLKAHLHTYFADALLEGRLTKLPPEISDPAFVLEKNDLSGAACSRYEVDLFPILDQSKIPQEQLTELTARYKTLAGDTYNEQDGMREGGLWRTLLFLPLEEDVNTLKAFAVFEKDWLQLQLELARLPRKSG